MRHRVPTRLALCAALWLAVSAQRSAVTYYVATTGNNGNPGTIGSPFQTLNYAVGQLSAGDTLLVRGGTYAESLVNVIPSGTSWSNVVRIKNYPSETVWMQPSSGNWVIYFDGTTRYIEIDGININGTGIGDASVFFDDRTGGTPNHIRFQNLEVHHREGVARTNAAVTVGGHDNEFLYMTVHGTGGPYAFYLLGENLLVDHCDVYDTSLAGIQIYHNPIAGAPPSGSVVSNTKIHDIITSGFFGAADIRLWGIIVSGSGHTLKNNVIYNNSIPYADGNSGIYVYNATGAQVLHNTIVGNTGNGVYVNAGSVGTLVRNNILYNNTHTAFVNLGSGTTADHNPTSNPLFVNAGAGNYQLQAGSPAIGAGVASAATTDYAGVARPQGGTYDAGAYEYVAAGSPPAAPTGLRIVP